MKSPIPGAAKAGSSAKNVFKDKRVQIGLAVAAVLGLVALVRRGGAAPGAGDAPGQSINTGTLDSTGMDNYNAIAQIGQAWQDVWNDQFKDFNDSLTDIGDKLGQLKPPVTTVPGSTYNVPPINKSLPTGRGFYILQAGDTLESIAKAKKTSVGALKALNPGTLLNHLGVGEAIRLRSAAGPAPKGKKGQNLWR